MSLGMAQNPKRKELSTCYIFFPFPIQTCCIQQCKWRPPKAGRKSPERAMERALGNPAWSKLRGGGRSIPGAAPPLRAPPLRTPPSSPRLPAFEFARPPNPSGVPRPRECWRGAALTCPFARGASQPGEHLPPAPTGSPAVVAAGAWAS